VYVCVDVCASLCVCVCASLCVHHCVCRCESLCVCVDFVITLTVQCVRSRARPRKPRGRLRFVCVCQFVIMKRVYVCMCSGGRPTARAPGVCLCVSVLHHRCIIVAGCQECLHRPQSPSPPRPACTEKVSHFVINHIPHCRLERTTSDLPQVMKGMSVTRKTVSAGYVLTHTPTPTPTHTHPHTHTLSQR
jgi:hypothetical protein